MRVQVLGGFLGAGKTTLARALAAELRKTGERVAIITNDQGHALVDTELCRDDADYLYEVGGGCFCCRYPELESAILAASEEGATVAIAEAVGSCTDLVATVLGPLADRQGALSIDSYAVVVDPWRINHSEGAGLGDDVDFLIRKQIEEADIVLVSRADLGPPDVTRVIRNWNGGAPILSVSGRTGAGIPEWRALSDEYRSQPLSIDYDRYAAAESLLGWCNARVRLLSARGLNPRETIRCFLGAMVTTPLAHVKVTGLSSTDDYGGAITRREGEIELRGSTSSDVAYDMRWLINARVALPPAELEHSVRDAVAQAAQGADIIWEQVDCFSPMRPNPTHRYAARRKTAENASCCAAFYQRDDVRRLLGDSYHPGGTELTLKMMRAVDMRAGFTVLDVACGTGESLRAILDKLPVLGVGVDSAPPPSTDERLQLIRGDAHELPRDDSSVDVVLCECALSTFTDQSRALREMHRVLRPGGFMAVSDMVVEGEVPETLRAWVHSGTCLERAMSSDAYQEMMQQAGFTIVNRWDASDGLTELLTRVKRNLIGWISAAASGTVATQLPFDVRAARGTLKDAGKAVADGSIRYGVFIGRKTQ